MSAPRADRLFVDEVEIYVRSGRGGDGCVSFRRELFVPKGGPDGGDGGHGGSVYLVARDGIDTLLDLAGKHHWRAEDGKPGAGAKCHGKRGRDLDVVVPTGTIVYDAKTGRRLADLVKDGQRVRIAFGGRGGHGNVHFATPTHQTPREAQPGQPGRERHLRLELKLIADVGFVGLPNAGKSTLLSRLTNARPKIAAYPFTTITPQLGIAELPGYRRLVLADIPGLIEGAHEGVGLGATFLRHIERTRVLAHLVDVFPLEGAAPPVEAYRVVRAELERYSPQLAARRELVVATKTDLTDGASAAEALADELGKPVMGISAVSGKGLRELLEALWQAVEEARQEEASVRPEKIDFGPEDEFEEEDEFADELGSEPQEESPA